MTLDTAISVFGIAGLLVGALVVTRASRETRAIEIWRGEAEAHKARADRLQADLTEIKERLARIEEENSKLLRLLRTRTNE
ncbi:hypothetical protein [Streptomyces ginkgonis]|uniref:hypothetical protein n=1 Tax=Streptomyces ginkgonis TaxID=1812259 RepID=UPI002176D6BB|nr:hypothetical protein [Streptomyces ginkgonis]